MPELTVLQEKEREVKKGTALAAFVQYGTVTAACEAAGISRLTWYDWKEADPDFKQGAETAKAAIADGLEQEAIHRAVKEKSDTLLIFLLKGHKPDKFADRKQVTNIHVDAALTLGLAKKRLQRQPVLIDGESTTVEEGKLS